MSEELDELMLLADRILVLYEGRIAGEVEPSVVKEIGEVGELMTSGAAGGEPISAGRQASPAAPTEDGARRGEPISAGRVAAPPDDAPTPGGGSRAGLA